MGMRTVKADSGEIAVYDYCDTLISIRVDDNDHMASATLTSEQAAELSEILRAFAVVTKRKAQP